MPNLISQFRVPCDGQGSNVRHRAAADEQPSRGVRQVTKLAQPIQSNKFDFCWSGSLQPRPREHVEPGCQSISHDTDEIAGARHEGKKARMVYMRDIFE